MEKYLVATNKSIYNLKLNKEPSGNYKLDLFFHGADDTNLIDSLSGITEFESLNEKLNEKILRFVEKSRNELSYGLYAFNKAPKTYELIHKPRVRPAIV